MDEEKDPIKRDIAKLSYFAVELKELCNALGIMYVQYDKDTHRFYHDCKYAWHQAEELGKSLETMCADLVKIFNNNKG